MQVRVSFSALFTPLALIMIAAPAWGSSANVAGFGPNSLTLSTPRSFNENAAIVAEDAASINLEFNLTGVDNQTLNIDGQDRSFITSPGEGVTIEYGKPMLPMVSRFIVVPSDKDVELEYTIGSQTRVTAKYPPALATEQQLVLGAPASLPELTEIYPPRPVEISAPIVIRGVRLVKLTTYPIQYDPVNCQYIHNDQINATLNFTNDEPVNPARFPVRRHRSQEFLKVIRDLAINGDQVGRDDPDRDADPEYIGHYLVVVHANLLQYAGDFIEWRRKSGYKMDILVPASPSDPARTKNEIQARYDAYLNAGEDPFDQLMLIGDYSRYDNIGVNGEAILESHTGTSVWGVAINHADYLHATLEGNDDNLDVGIGRWIAGNQNIMALASGRTLRYEATPNMQDRSWFDRVGVYSQHWGNTEQSAWHVTIHTNVRWAEEVCQRLGFQDINFYEQYAWDQQGAQVGPWVRDLYNEGVNLLLGRAENYFWRNNFNGVNDNTVFPISVVLSGHGEWAAWCSWRAYSNGAANHLRGPVNTTCGWGDPATATNSAAWLEMVNGILQKDLSMGWAYSNALNANELYFPDFQYFGRSIYSVVKTDLDHYGDPGIKPWIGAPTQVEAQFPASITANTRLVEVHVNEFRDGPDIEGARVTLYAPGAIPAFNNNAYRTYDGMLMRTALTDADGFARFVFDDDVDLPGSTALITVTGRDICPFFGDIDIVNSVSAVDVSSYELIESEGNGDGVMNPGEIFTLNLRAINRSNAAAYQDVRAVVWSESPWIEVEENDLSFGDINARQSADADESVVIRVHQSCPDGQSRPKTSPELMIDFRSGNMRSYSAIELVPEAPHFELYDIVGGDQLPARQRAFDLDVKNVGNLDSGPITARLVSQGIGFSVVTDQARYQNIGINRHSRINGNTFLITGNTIAVPGSRHKMILILTTEAGFVDTVFFDLQIDTPRQNAPQGPDKYGYICFDDTDNDWDISPDYDWIEISTRDNNRDYDGISCNFNGNSDRDVGESQVVQMGMETQFYGQIYDRITICTNGYICLGNQPRITNFQNWPLDRAMGGGAGMIAPFWDWLDYTADSRILYFHDEDEGRFIIEWYRMRHHSGGNTDLNFQIILYDNEVWITETGDQMILFQYRTISNVQGQVDGVLYESDTPFASIGISSPDGTSGISYGYNNTYPVTSAALANQRAILFTTSPRFKAGDLFGRVTDHETGEPIEGAMVFTEHGFTALTDADGEWRINDALAEVPFDITARKAGYNDSTLFDQFLPEDEELEINFDLLHPEFVPSVRLLSANLPVGDRVELDFNVTNTGNGPLDWWVEERLLGDANADPWDYRRGYDFGIERGDSRIQGVVSTGEEFYVSGSGNDTMSAVIYVFNRDGEFLRYFDQPRIEGDTRGMRDLAWDGELIWGAVGLRNNIVFGITTEGEVVHQFGGPYQPTTGIAWDPDHEVLWLTTTTDNPVAFTRDGQAANLAEVQRGDLRIYGLAYWPDDPDGYCLYIFHKERDTNRQTIHRYNIDTAEMRLVTYLEPQGGGAPEGAFITNEFDVYSWVLMTVSNLPPQDGGDRVDVWQLDARRDWFGLDLSQGTLQQGERQDYVLTLDANNLPTVEFSAELVFYHNAAGGRWILPITLGVVGGVRDLELDLHGGWNLVSINVEPNQLDEQDILEPLLQENKLIIMKNGEGQFFMPEMDFSNIDHWVTSEGYQLYLSEDALLTVRGRAIPADEAVPLEEGWNLCAYYPTVPVDAVEALSDIVEVLDIIKDVDGNFYMPEFGFSNIGELREGQGYQIRVGQGVDLVYRIPDRGFLATDPCIPDKPSHFKNITKTCDNMSVLVMADQVLAGAEIGVFNSEGRLLGAGVVDTQGRCGIAVWGDDVLTETIDGAQDQEPLHFRLWNGESEIPVLFDIEAGSDCWTANSWMAARLRSAGSAPLSFGLVGAWPNPTNGPARLSFGLETTGTVTLKVYDLNGRLAQTILSGEYQAGIHSTVWNTDLIASGIYLVRLESAGRASGVKVAVVK